MNDNAKTASKLQAPSFSSKLRAPTAIPKPPETGIQDSLPIQQQEKITLPIPTSSNNMSKASPVKAFVSTLKFQEPPQRFSMQPQPTKQSLKLPSAIPKNSQQSNQSDLKITSGVKPNTNIVSVSKISEVLKNTPVVIANVQQDQKQLSQQQPQKQAQQQTLVVKASMIGKGIPKPVVQINLDNDSPFKTTDAVDKIIETVQARPRASSTIGRFGFRGGHGGNQLQTPIKLPESIQEKTQTQQIIIDKQEEEILQKPFIQKESNEIKVEEKPKISLEETIKNLELNLANLPTTFNRASRLKEFVPLQKLQQREEIKISELPSIQGGYNTIGNGPNLRDRMNAKRDQLKIAKQLYSNHEDEDPFEKALTPQVRQPVEQEEERNLPLTAFLQPLNLFQESTAPIGDHGLNEYEDDEDLMNDDIVFERAADLENDLLIEDLQPSLESKKDYFHEQIQSHQVQVMMVKGDFDEVEELKQSSDSNIQTLSTQPTQPPEILKKHPKDHQVKPQKFDQLSQASSTIKPQSQPGDHLSSLSSSSANPLQLLRQVSGGNHPRIGLSACQRQGPALAAKKAFEHKRKRFARELNADALNQHLGSINDGRQQCEHCGRRFNPECFERHTKICEKVFIRKRKAFSSLKHRAINEEHLIQVEKAQQKFSYYQENQKLNTKWKLRSQEFRQIILKAKGLLPVQQEETKDLDDRVHCKYCDKRFAQSTADRHIPLCEAKSKDLKNTTKVIKTFAKTTTSGFYKQTSFMKK